MGNTDAEEAIQGVLGNPSVHFGDPLRRSVHGAFDALAICNCSLIYVDSDQQLPYAGPASHEGVNGEYGDVI